MKFFKSGNFYWKAKMGVRIGQWAGVAYHKRSWLSTALCSKSEGLIGVDRDSVQSIQYGKWMVSAHRFAWYCLGQFYYYDSTQKLKVSKHDKVHFSPVWIGHSHRGGFDEKWFRSNWFWTGFMVHTQKDIWGRKLKTFVVKMKGEYDAHSWWLFSPVKMIMLSPNIMLLQFQYLCMNWVYKK